MLTTTWGITRPFHNIIHICMIDMYDGSYISSYILCMISYIICMMRILICMIIHISLVESWYVSVLTNKRSINETRICGAARLAWWKNVYNIMLYLNVALVEFRTLKREFRDNNNCLTFSETETFVFDLENTPSTHILRLNPPPCSRW